MGEFRVRLNLSPHQNHRGDEPQTHEPPKPMEALGDDFGFVLSKFACDEFVVIELFIRIFAFGIGPAGGFVRTTFGAGGGARWNGNTAVFAVVRCLRMRRGH